MTELANFAHGITLAASCALYMENRAEWYAVYTAMHLVEIGWRGGSPYYDARFPWASIDAAVVDLMHRNYIAGWRDATSNMMATTETTNQGDNEMNTQYDANKDYSVDENFDYSDALFAFGDDVEILEVFGADILCHLKNGGMCHQWEDETGEMHITKN